MFRELFEVLVCGSYSWVVHVFGTEMIRLGTEELIEPEILILGPVSESFNEISVGTAL